MRAEEIIKFIKNPELLDRESVSSLKKLVAEFPYFQSAHLLLSLSAKKWDASVYQQSLKKTAIVVTNRNHFYKLVHQLEKGAEKEIKNEVISLEETTKQELNILKSAEVLTEEVKQQEEPIAEQPVKENKKQEDPITVIKKEVSAENTVEQEIKKSLVNAFVEKEILKTNQVNKLEDRTEKPENFSDWLQFLKKNNGQSYGEIENEVNKEKVKTAEKIKQKEKGELKGKEKKKALIDKIIENNPGMIRQKEEQKFFKSDFKAKESLVENEHLVTETLAKIYALQGNINKAIRAYEILSLKFPQKSAYFASLIQKLKSNP
ncbi:MAG: hypothetical protein H0W61_17670 [Bacteroidetes bacterium]|nr:hypothetical protein [Bacteroidota bacterium]